MRAYLKLLLLFAVTAGAAGWRAELLFPTPCRSPTASSRNGISSSPLS